MRTYTLYRLTFKTQLHLGRASGPAQASSLGLEKTETYIPADTLFAALCQTWATFYDAESLTDFLSSYTEDKQVLPFTLTSAFPFARDVHLYPKPLNVTDPPDAETKSRKTVEKLRKILKKVRFVSQPIFEAIISGNVPEIAKEQMINGEQVWVSPEESVQLEASAQGPEIWKTATRPRVTVGPLNSGSEIWHVETTHFNVGCGLWLAAAFDSEETQRKVETLLRVLGDTGIGGERNAGYGAFNVSIENNVQLPSVEDSTQFVTLSPICPKSPDQLSQLLTDNSVYALNGSMGWIGTAGASTRRKQVNMFAEGSVLHSLDIPIGRLVDLSPDGWEHPVYRYGYGWPIGIKGASE